MTEVFNKLLEHFNLRNKNLRNVRGFPGYYISNSGDIYSTRNKRMRKIKTQRKEGRPSVTLTRNGKRYKKYIHRMLWESFNNKDIPEGYEIDHINGNPKDNTIDNLNLLSKRDNISKSSTGKKHSFSVKVALIDYTTKKVIEEFPSIKDCNKYFKKNKIPLQANRLLNGYDSFENLHKLGYDLIRKNKSQSNIKHFKEAKKNPIKAIRDCFNLNEMVKIKEHPFIKSVIARYFGDSDGMIYKIKTNTVEQKRVKINDSGYINISVNGISFQAHRFVYECFYRIELNKNVFIDHIDSVRTNNAINNLRLSNPKHNAQSAHNKKIFVYYYMGHFIDSFSSVNKAAKFIETNQSNLSGHLSGKNFIIRKKYFITTEKIEDPKKYFTERYLLRYEKNGYKVLWKWAKYSLKFGYIENEYDNISEIIELYGDIDSSLEEHIKGKFSTCLESQWLTIPPTIDFPKYHPESDKYESSFKDNKYIERIYKIQNEKYNKKLPTTTNIRHLADAPKNEDISNK